MAKQEVSGRTAEGIEDVRSEFEETERGQNGVPFEDAYCLTKIQRQPDEYDGPERYCAQWTASDRTDFCHWHEHYENLEATAAMTHGVSALREHLVEDFSERERQAYGEIMEEWTEFYDLDPHADHDTLHAMAVEMVREHRADRVIEEDSDGGEDLTTFRRVYGPEGEFLTDEEHPHYLLDEKRAIRRVIQSCKDDLDITRKRRQKHEVEQDQADNLSAIAEGIDESVTGGEYDPSEFEDE